MNDREKLIELLTEVIRDFSYFNRHRIGIFADHLIANGVVIQKQSEWVCTDIFPWGDVYRCLECGCDVDVTQLTNYCPDCGAKMKEVK